MSDPETTPSASATGGQGTCSACECLQKQLNLLLIGLIVLSATLAVFLLMQTRYIRHDLTNMKPAASAIIQGYNQEKPAVDAFVSKVTEYARTHPDFAPIAHKYQLQVTNAAPAAKPGAVPAPAPKK